MSLAIIQLLPLSFHTTETVLETAYLAPYICRFLKYCDLSWHNCCFSSLNWSVLFRCPVSPSVSFSMLYILQLRFVLVKYSDRGLIEEQVSSNGRLKLFNTLFWVTIITEIISAQCMIIIKLYHGQFLADSHRFVIDCIALHLEIFLSVQICTGIIQAVEHEEPFPTTYLLNFAVKTLRIVVVLVLSLGITWSWTRKGLSGKINRKQVNVLTLKQTIILILFLYFDYLLTAGCRHLIDLVDSKLLLAIEMGRILLIENILLKFLLPFFLIKNTKSKIPLLWSKDKVGNVTFFMTELKPIQPENYHESTRYKYVYISSLF